MGQSHYFDPEPGVASRRSTVRLSIGDLEVELLVDRGVFSANAVDPGTVALLKSNGRGRTTWPREGDLLDLGCGYGPIACTLARRHPDRVVWAVDVNTRALELTGRQRRGPAAPQRPDQAPRRDAPWPRPSGDLVQPADKDRQGRSARSSHPVAGAPVRAGARPAWWCTATSEETHWPNGSAARGGRCLGWPPSGATGSSRCARREAAPARPT